MNEYHVAVGKSYPRNRLPPRWFACLATNCLIPTTFKCDLHMVFLCVTSVPLLQNEHRANKGKETGE